MLRENVLDAAAVDVPADAAEAVVHLDPKEGPLAKRAGIGAGDRLSEKLEPLAERLVIPQPPHGPDGEGRGRSKGYATRRASRWRSRSPRWTRMGAPVPAELAVSVVDDTVLSFADDKTGHLLSKMLLEPEMPGKVEEPQLLSSTSPRKTSRAGHGPAHGHAGLA
jgi:hypothetical protein